MSITPGLEDSKKTAGPAASCLRLAVSSAPASSLHPRADTTKYLQIFRRRMLNICEINTFLMYIHYTLMVPVSQVIMHYKVPAGNKGKTLYGGVFSIISTYTGNFLPVILFFNSVSYSDLVFCWNYLFFICPANFGTKY